MKLKFIIFALIPVLVSSAFMGPSDGRSAKVLHQMFDSVKRVKTLRMKIGALERVEKKYLTAHSEIKLQTSPRKVYFINRSKKLEILFDAEVSNHKALVKTNAFPYITLNLDPSGSLMRKNQHYTINELGFEFISTSVAFTINRDKNGLNNFRFVGKTTRNNTSCYLLEYENKAFAYMDYTVKERETISHIAGRLCLNDYLIRYKNNLLNEFGYIKKGRVLKIPTLYCRKAVLFINDKNFLPVSVSLYDDEGLFESYDFTDVEVNPALSQMDFDRENKAYGF